MPTIIPRMDEVSNAASDVPSLPESRGTLLPVAMECCQCATLWFFRTFGDTAQILREPLICCSLQEY